MYQLVDNDILISIALSMDNFDQIVNMSSTNSILNQLLKNPLYLETIKNNVGVIRPVIDWKDLMRENSKINPTEYAIICEDVPDYPSYNILLENAISGNRHDLIQKYFQHFIPEMFSNCNSSNTLKMLLITLYKSNLILHNKPDQFEELIIYLNEDGQFSPEYFKFIHYIIIPQFPSIYIKSNGIVYNVKLRPRIEDVILADYPLDELFTPNIINKSSDGIIVDNISYPILSHQVGPNNLKYSDYILSKNPRSDMIINLIQSGNITNINLQSAVSVSSNVNDNGLDLVKYLVEVNNEIITESLIDDAVSNGNFDIALYLFNNYPNYDNDPPEEILSSINLRGLQILHHIYPNQFEDIVTNDIITVKDNIYGGDNDNPECMLYIHSITGNCNFIFNCDNEYYNMVTMDNIKCASILYNDNKELFKIEHDIDNVIVFSEELDIIFSMTMDQYRRFKVYTI